VGTRPASLVDGKRDVEDAVMWHEAEAAAAYQDDDAELDVERPPARPRVVVAHAHGFIRRAVARSLERAGYVVAVARHGDELRERLDDDGIAAVVLAVELLDVIGRLPSHVPVVVLGDPLDPALRATSERIGTLLPTAPFDLCAVTDAVDVVCRRGS